MVSRIAVLKSYYVVLDYDELQLIAVVSNAVTTEYMVIIAVEERRHKKALTFDQVETCLMSYWQRVYGDSGPQDKKKSAEITFSAVASSRKTDSRFWCINCDKPGRRVEDEIPTSVRIKDKANKQDFSNNRLGQARHTPEHCARGGGRNCYPQIPEISDQGERTWGYMHYGGI
jgi:hypothetical protein